MRSKYVQQLQLAETTKSCLNGANINYITALRLPGGWAWSRQRGASLILCSASCVKCRISVQDSIWYDDDDERIYFNVAWVRELQGHVTVIVGSRSSQCSETFISQNSCKTGQKVEQSSVYCGKLAMTALNVLSPADCSRQMQQPPGRLGCSW